MFYIFREMFLKKSCLGQITLQFDPESRMLYYFWAFTIFDFFKIKSKYIWGKIISQNEILHLKMSKQNI